MLTVPVSQLLPEKRYRRGALVQVSTYRVACSGITTHHCPPSPTRGIVSTGWSVSDIYYQMALSTIP